MTEIPDNTVVYVGMSPAFDLPSHPWRPVPRFGKHGGPRIVCELLTQHPHGMTSAALIDAMVASGMKNRSTASASLKYYRTQGWLERVKGLWKLKNKG